ncbi:MAG: S41 family peptidase [Bacteroidales bacterium]|nr:S41 family peptidase [Bacteroidales bacterium]
MKKIILVLFLAFSTFVQAQDKGFEISKNLEIFANVYKNVHLNYVDDVDPGKLMKTAIDAMLSSLDPYTNFYAESDIEDVKLQLLGEYGGVGALIHQQDGKIYVAEPYEGLPADKAGLKAGDRILEVNGTSTEGKTTSDVSGAMRGQSGTDVKLKLSRDGRTFDCTLTRQEIKLPNVPYSGILPSGIGYIKLSEFTQEAGKNVREAFRQLKKERPDMPGLIIDLRGNGGGLMNEAVEIVGMFVKRGELVVETKGKLASKNVKSYTRNVPEDLDMPVAVLIDGYSASASEIVSGSLQDFDRAVIIGSRSYGKGLVQNILPMTYNTQMKVTVSKYYIPSGRCIQALDYSHRDENGRATRVPDSLKTAFKTRNGRTVYDGYGIEPDVEVEQEYMSALSVVLVQKFLIFDYATQFVKTHPTIAPPSQFEITDEIYSDFRQFLAGKEYTYSTSTEKYLEDLKTIAKEEKYLEALDGDIKALEAKLKADKADDLTKYREEISEMLKSEILSRYYYQKGRIEGSLVHDKDVLKAVEILTDKAQYQKILTKK